MAEKLDLLPALTKAEEHLAAADAIAALGNYPLAYSHLVLGLEEWIVLNIREAVSLDFIELAAKGASDPFALDPRTLYHHREKILLGLSLMAITIPIRRRLTLFYSAAKEGRKVTRGEIDQAWPGWVAEATSIASDIDRLELQKEGGFYSADTDARGKNVLRASKTEFVTLRGRLAELLEAERFAIEHPRTEQELESLREVVERGREEVLGLAEHTTGGKDTQSTE